MAFEEWIVGPDSGSQAMGPLVSVVVVSAVVVVVAAVAGAGEEEWAVVLSVVVVVVRMGYLGVGASKDCSVVAVAPMAALVSELSEAVADVVGVVFVGVAVGDWVFVAVVVVAEVDQTCPTWGSHLVDAAIGGWDGSGTEWTKTKANK